MGWRLRSYICIRWSVCNYLSLGLGLGLFVSRIGKGLEMALAARIHEEVNNVQDRFEQELLGNR